MGQWENGGPMKILGVQFDYGEKTDYARLASVFDRPSALRNVCKLWQRLEAAE